MRCMQDLARDDFAAIATHCPQLEHLSISGDVMHAAFGPLLDMPCLSSLEFDNVCAATSKRRKVMSSLPHLTKLTSIGIVDIVSEYDDMLEGEHDFRHVRPPLSPIAMHPWVSTLHGLRKLTLEFNEMTLQVEMAQYISRLTQLTCLQVRLRGSTAALPPRPAHQHDDNAWQTGCSQAKQKLCCTLQFRADSLSALCGFGCRPKTTVCPTPAHPCPGTRPTSRSC